MGPVPARMKVQSKHDMLVTHLIDVFTVSCLSCFTSMMPKTIYDTIFYLDFASKFLNLNPHRIII